MKIKLIFHGFVLFFIIGCGTKANQKADENPRPNILFLFADDQRADALGCAGNSYIKTPHIDKLAERGIRFPNTYVMGGHHGAICAPSRAMLMSGKSLFHVYDRLDGVMTLPMWLSKAGYVTFGTGKWHNGAASFEASFQKGENVFIGGMSNHFQVPCQNMDHDGKLGKPQNKAYSTDLFADAAIDFLETYSSEPQDQPFFCYVSFTAPHDPRSPRNDYVDQYKADGIPLPGNYMPLPLFQFDDLNIRDETLAPWPRTSDIIKESLADYYALISHLDQRVGDIVATLEKNGLLNNTIIVYAADNGLAIGSHGLLGKQNLYEHSTRVPFIISGPGVPAHENRDALVYLYDIFPTLCSLLDMPPPDSIDGQNLVPVIRGESDQVRSSLYTAYRNTARAVRTSEWKLIRYPQHGYSQLFHLKEDPLELNNLAADPEFGDQVEEMNRLLAQWYQATDDTATMEPAQILPLEYDLRKLKQTPDQHQPEYVLEKYFKGNTSD